MPGPRFIDEGRRADGVRTEPAGDLVERGFCVAPGSTPPLKRQLSRCGSRWHEPSRANSDEPKPGLAAKPGSRIERAGSGVDQLSLARCLGQRPGPGDRREVSLAEFDADRPSR